MHRRDFIGAAALAFYLVLAVFPALVFLLSLLPYLPVEDLDRAIMDLLHQGMPSEAAAMLESTVQSLVNQRKGGLLSLGLAGALWAASTGMYAVMRQLNITYNVEEARSFIRGRATALLLTLLFGILVVSAFMLIVLGGVLQEWIGSHFGRSQLLLSGFALTRWLIILAFLLLGFAFIYYAGPNVEQKFKWITPGSVIGVVLLVGMSMLFRLYIEHFGNYEATYGSLGAVVILMLWFYAAGLVLLIGSEVNVAAEKRMPGGKQAGEKTLDDGAARAR